jgi:hypothetical protein
VSCEGDSKTDRSGPVSAGEFARAFADAWCSGLDPCCESSEYSFDPAQCRASVSASIDATVKAQSARPNVTFDETVAGTCIEAQRTRFGVCEDEDLFRSGNAACLGLFRGTVALGGACMEDAECSPVSGKSVACDAGVCAIDERPAVESLPDPVGVGEACSQTCVDDQYGTSCYYADLAASPAGGCYQSDGLGCSQTTLKCERLPKLGEACMDGRCPVDTYCAGGICVAGKATGPCPSLEQCLQTSRCDIDTMTCIPKKPNGSACNDLTECLSSTCEGDVCRDWSAATEQRCAGALGG